MTVGLGELLESMLDRIEELKARVEKLKLYATHPRSCSKWFHHQIEGSYIKPERPCDCGLEELL